MSWTERRLVNKERFETWIFRFWQLVFIFIMGMFGLFAYISMNIPSFEELENPAFNLSSEVYGSNGQSLGRYFIENRVPVRFNELSPYLVRGVVATEDKRFYSHSGIDQEALARVFFKTVIGGNTSSGGGSTITQQLAKLLYSDRDFTSMGKLRKTFALIGRKFREWITAVKLERSYTKEEIIAMYFNQFNFVNGAYGIRAASEIYFNASQDSLKIEQAALLVGMLNNPSKYNPLKYPEAAKSRRNVVLTRMAESNMLTTSQLAILKNKPLDMSRFRRKTHADGLATYFRMEIRKDIAKILDQPECRKPDGGKYDIFRDGLRIYTTIDPVMQEHAELAMKEHMSKLQSKFFKVWKGKDPWTHKYYVGTEDSTTAQALENRAKGLVKIIRESDRYLEMRDKILGPILSKLEEAGGGSAVSDSEIDRMFFEEKNRGEIARLVRRKKMSQERADRYTKMMESKVYGPFKTEWNSFQEKVKIAFSEKHKMKVYAYNTREEKDTTMSPLDSLRYHRMFLQAGILAVEPQTGFVKAWVGGINHKFFQFDHCRTSRQVGSTFKPFIYATAISQQGISPCYKVVDQAYTIKKDDPNFSITDDWTPKNAKEKYSGRTFTLKEALKESINTVSVYLMKQIGTTEAVRGLVHNMGIDSTLKRADKEYRVPKRPSICLGSCDLSVLEMTGAYSTFANNGVFVKPTFIERIEDKNGKIIYKAGLEERQALPENANYVMMDMLQYATKNAGGFDGVKTVFGGKTGTTNDFVDGWFMGVTPGLVVGTWVGGEDPWIRFTNLDDGQGSAMARPIFAKLLKRLEKDPSSNFISDLKFPEPKGDLGIIIDCNQYASQNLEEVDSLQTGEFFEDPFKNTEGADPNAPPTGTQETPQGTLPSNKPKPTDQASKPVNPNENTGPTKPNTTPKKPSTIVRDEKPIND
jgi:penicillin-binding protein 1A